MADFSRFFRPNVGLGGSGMGMTELWVERTGVRRYTGRSSRGAEVLIGSVTDEGVFTPVS